jgi:hypothetical protein
LRRADGGDKLGLNSNGTATKFVERCLFNCVGKSKEKLLSAFSVATVIFLCFLAIYVISNNFVHEPWTTPANACINNLRQIDAAANQFALEHSLTNGAPINFPSDLTPYIKLNSAGKIPSCPQGGIYHISKVGETPTCSLGTTVTPAHVEP